ncbi:MAG: YiiX/YebB-like N1pC/P60 family cysteine hydrolase [Pseudomonadota bacterium]
MSSVSLLFCRSHDALSVAIRALTWSRWSHVALIDGYCAIEALAPDGVQMTETEQVLMRSSAFELVDLPCRNPEAVRAAAASQVGKPYDYKAIVGLGLHRKWQDADAWFCSELIAWAFEQAGEPLFRADCLHRVTPQHLWMLEPAAPVVARPAPI